MEEHEKGFLLLLLGLKGFGSEWGWNLHLSDLSKGLRG